MTAAERDAAAREREARGLKAGKLADVLLALPALGLDRTTPRVAEAALRDLSLPGWAAAASVAKVRPPSRATVVLTAAVVRQRMENR